MIAIGIRLLTGWSMATDSADRNRPEWPLHPDRIFMALAAAFFETDGDNAEQEALHWLERQGAPEMWASEATHRTATTTYVPVNDSAPLSRRMSGTPSRQQVQAGLQLFPENRLRQARQFPVAIPRDPNVYLVWPADPAPEVREGLRSLCGKVIRVGHSASMVQAWVEEAPPPPNLIPTEGLAQRPLRVPGPGRLEHLAAQYRSNRRPERSRWVSYAPAQPEHRPEIPDGVFDGRLLVLGRVSGSRLGLESTQILVDKLRSAVVRHCLQPVPEWVSGHTPEGRPSQEPHLALLPLPFVDDEHADGHLLGVALAIPKRIEPAEVGRCLNPVLGFSEEGSLRQVHLYDGPHLDWLLEMERRDSPPATLRSRAWTRPARRWATVTPIVFDRHPKGREREAQAEAMVAGACERIGLPRPLDVILSAVSLHRGVPHSRSFPPIRRKSDNGRLQHQHAVITFGEPVGGPVVLGAGRYRGYGLCRPVQWKGDDVA